MILQYPLWELEKDYGVPHKAKKCQPYQNIVGMGGRRTLAFGKKQGQMVLLPGTDVENKSGTLPRILGIS